METAFKEVPEISVEFDRQKFFTGLYRKVFPSVVQFVRRQGGTLDDAKDVFHDALIIFYEKKVVGLAVHLTDEAYVFGIVKHRWIKRVKESQQIILCEEESAITLPEDFDATPKTQSIVSFLRSAGEKCMTLLQAFYYEKLDMESIRKTFGFSSVRSATVQKYKCLEKVRDLVKNKSMNYEDFIKQA